MYEKNFFKWLVISDVIIQENKSKSLILDNILSFVYLDFLKKGYKKNICLYMEKRISDQLKKYKNIFISTPFNSKNEAVKDKMKNPRFRSIFLTVKKADEGILKNKYFNAHAYHLENEFPIWAKAKSYCLTNSNFIFYNNIFN